VHVGVCRIEFQVSGARTLKDKRRVVHSIKDRVAGRFQVTIAEVGILDNPCMAELGFACVSNNDRHATSVLTKVAEFIEDAFPIVVLDVETEIVTW